MTVESQNMEESKLVLDGGIPQMLDMNGMSKVLVLMDQLDLIITNVVLIGVTCSLVVRLISMNGLKV